MYIYIFLSPFLLRRFCFVSSLRDIEGIFSRSEYTYLSLLAPGPRVAPRVLRDSSLCHTFSVTNFAGVESLLPSHRGRYIFPRNTRIDSHSHARSNNYFPRV
ncbi:hypothetical protein PUN28_016778 [Cardiocondyla obscurior]|uniref:Secreted protein n=1 Tax=Cardiocondyla obscurior TaxID=286306 RepID=A0AAW2ERD7_9HYME